MKLSLPPLLSNFTLNSDQVETVWNDDDEDDEKDEGEIPRRP